MPVKVFVGNLSYYTTESQLADLLSEAGQVVDVSLSAGRAGSRSTRTATVTFANSAGAARCIRRFHEHELGGKKIVVSAQPGD